MRSLTVTVTAVVFALALACGSGTDETPINVPPPVNTAAGIEAQVATISDAIAADPGGAEAILQNNGMSKADYEAHLFDIAMNPSRTKAYLDARK